MSDWSVGGINDNSRHYLWRMQQLRSHWTSLLNFSFHDGWAGASLSSMWGPRVGLTIEAWCTLSIGVQGHHRGFLASSVIPPMSPLGTVTRSLS